MNGYLDPVLWSHNCPKTAGWYWVRCWRPNWLSWSDPAPMYVTENLCDRSSEMLFWPIRIQEVSTRQIETGSETNNLESPQRTKSVKNQKTMYTNPYKNSEQVGG